MKINQIKSGFAALTLLAVAAHTTTAAVLTVQQGTNGYSGCEGATVTSFSSGKVNYGFMWGASFGGNGNFIVPARFNNLGIAGQYTSIEKISLRLRVTSNNLNGRGKLGLIFNNRGNNCGWQASSVAYIWQSTNSVATNTWVGPAGNIAATPYVPGVGAWDFGPGAVNNGLPLMAWAIVDGSTTNKYVEFEFGGLSFAQLKTLVDAWSFNYSSGTFTNGTQVYTNNPGMFLAFVEAGNITGGDIRFASQTDGNIDYRPRLTIHYTATNETTVKFQQDVDGYSGTEGLTLSTYTPGPVFFSLWAASFGNASGNMISAARFNNLASLLQSNNTPARVMLRLYADATNTLAGSGTLGVIFNNRGGNSGWVNDLATYTYTYSDLVSVTNAWSGPSGTVGGYPYVPATGAWDLTTNSNNGLPIMGSVEVNSGKGGYVNIVFDQLTGAQLKNLLAVWSHDYGSGSLLNGGQTYTQNPGFFLALTATNTITGGDIRFHDETDGASLSVRPMLLVTYPNAIPTVTLNYQNIGTGVVLTWSSGTLQTATSVEGAYLDLPSATSPYTNNYADPQRFFRVKVQ